MSLQPLPPNVILYGGPIDEIPEHERIRHVTDLDDTVKIFRGHRYEHYVSSGRTERHGEHELVVFDWTRCTYVAE
ncbi:DUF5988 family protein [Streptomyces sp. NPDC053750]|uniref:DUF5988 family protein n=1 Tax=Streptomyces sp. NPDC053750 TaxID=3365714 RepID=UPI0037D8B9F8